MKMAINVEPDSRTLSSSVAWPWKSHYTRKSVFRDLRLTDFFTARKTGLDAHDNNNDSLCTAIWTPCYPMYTLLSMRGSRIFRQGGGGSGSIWHKKPWQRFFFLVLSLFYWSQMVKFEENSFFKVPTFSRGFQLFPRESNCLYPIETHITCDFPGGSGPPDPPLDPHLLSRSAGDSFFPFSRRWVVFFSFI